MSSGRPLHNSLRMVDRAKTIIIKRIEEWVCKQVDVKLVVVLSVFYVGN